LIGGESGNARRETAGIAMALSDYERRVLDEIESELADLHSPRLVRLGGALKANLWMILALLLAAATVVVAAVFAPAPLAAPAGLLAGVLAGFAVSSRLWRRRGRNAAR
jgi:VIT1/CCC1 family predicted Fe2+/Mn2+ transporter